MDGSRTGTSNGATGAGRWLDVKRAAEELGISSDAVRRADTIIAQLTQANASLARRVPELEAPPTLRGAPQMVAEEPEGLDAPITSPAPQEAAERRSWWRRLLDG